MPLAPLVAAHELRRQIRPSRYTDAQPFCLRWIEPERIRRSLLETAPRRPQWGRVIDGNWESEWELFDGRAVPRGITQRYREGRDWRETALFDAFREQLARFGNAWGYTDVGEFTERCREIDRLHDSLSEDGYRRQESLHGSVKYATTARLDEINVDIGPDGRFYWRSYGQHRLAIAKLLEIDVVPVVIHRRHARWQALRSAIRNGDSEKIDALGTRANNHPDLRDIGEANA